MACAGKGETVVSLHSLSGCNEEGISAQGLEPSQSVSASTQHKRGHNTNSHTLKSEFASLFIRANQLILFVFSFVPRLWTIFNSPAEVMLLTYSLV